MDDLFGKCVCVSIIINLLRECDDNVQCNENESNDNVMIMQCSALQCHV